MKTYEKGSTGLLHKAERLKNLLLEHPSLPLLVLVGCNSTNGGHSITFCSSVSAYLGEFLDCNQAADNERVYTDREEFQDALNDHLWKSFDGAESEFDSYFEKELESYEPYWKPCIIVEVYN